MVPTNAKDVRLLYFDGCPNWQIADARLRQALAEVGANPDAVVRQIVTTPQQATALGFRGSPSIIIDGKDPFAEPGAPTGLACRIYRTEAGIQPAPTVDQLREALSR